MDDLTTTRAELYLEDFEPGMTVELGEVAVTRDEVIDFGRRFDPQPFHIDEEKALRTPFGGLIASGWHTCAMFMRLWVDAVVMRAASLGGVGVDELRTPHPVRPGDTLSGTVEVVCVRPSVRKADRGTVTWRGMLYNQNGEVVLTLLCHGRIARRPSPSHPGDPAAQRR
jgi:acyl dehydratase